MGDNLPTKIVKQGKVQLLLRDGRKITLLSVLHNPRLARNITFFNGMSDAGVHTIFEKDSCKMVCGAMVLIRGSPIGTLYKLLGRIDTKFILEADGTSSYLVNATTLWNR